MASMNYSPLPHYNSPFGKLLAPIPAFPATKHWEGMPTTVSLNILTSLYGGTSCGSVNNYVKYHVNMCRIFHKPCFASDTLKGSSTRISWGCLPPLACLAICTALSRTCTELLFVAKQ